MHLLVQEIMDEFSYPERWPMTDAERVRFIKTVFRQAKTIAESEPFLRANVVRAAQNFAATAPKIKKSKRP